MSTASTPGGLPYPNGNDPVKNGDNVIGQLATALDPAWTVPGSLASGWVPLAANPARYRAVAGILELSGAMYVSAGVPAGPLTMFGVPAALAPVTDDTNIGAAAQVVCTPAAVATWRAATGYCWIKSTGAVTLYFPGSSTTNYTVVHLGGIRWRIKGLAAALDGAAPDLLPAGG